MNYQPIIDTINEMNTSQLVSLNNLYCQENSLDGEIFDNDEEFFKNELPKSYDALQKSFYGSYTFNDKFVKFDGYSNLESFDRFDSDDLPERIEKVAEYIYDNQREFSQFDFDFYACDEDEDEDEI